MGKKGRRLRCVFVPRDGKLEFVTVGTVLAHRGPGGRVESATVDGLYVDSAGLPHVRFFVTFEKPNRATISEGPRNLALAPFLSHFAARGTTAPRRRPERAA